MTKSQLEYVMAVAELRHFGLAAERCFVSQSTLSAMIIKFEDQIGIEIFDRKTKPVSVTLEGAALIQNIRLILKRMDDFDERVKELKGEMSGTLRIAVIPTVAPYLLPLFLSGFVRKHSGIRFVIREADTSQIIHSLKERRTDIAITALPLLEDGLIEHPLYNEPFIGYYADGCQKPGTDIRDMDAKNFWLLEDGHCMSAQMQHICALNHSPNHKTNLSFKAGSIASLISMTDSACGYTVLPYLSTIGMVEQQKVRLIPFKPPVPMRQIGLIVHEHFVKRRILQLLKTEILERVLPVLPGKTGSEQIVPVF